MQKKPTPSRKSSSFKVVCWSLRLGNAKLGAIRRALISSHCLLGWGNAAGSYLTRLRESGSEQVKGRVKSRKVNGKTVWTIEPVKQPVPAPQTPTNPHRFRIC